MTRQGFVDPENWKPVGIQALEPDAMDAVRAMANTLVTAGPGAGKTELLGQRGVYLLQTGACAYPRRILAISFKRDAAKNLRERFQRRCTKEQASRLDSMTFDAFAKLILDRFYRALPDLWTIPAGYEIGRFLTRDQFNEFLRSSADGLSNPNHASHWAAAQLNGSPTRNQILGVTQNDFNLAINEVTLHPLSAPNAAAFAQLVHIRLSVTKTPASLTFPLIGRLAQLIVETNPQIKNAFLATYSHVFMDEFQDTTGVQYGLMKSIFGDSQTVVTAVGDDKQKIMGWAGAQSDSFGVFQRDFLKGGALKGEKHIALQLNYRSNARIVEILNTLKKRLAPNEPDFKAARPAPNLPPEKICAVIYSPNADSESKALASFIKSELSQGTSARNIGLLVRQKASEWEKKLAPELAAQGITLRNEDRDVGGASIQDLMTEPYSQVIVDALDLLSRRRGGSAWVRVIEHYAGMEGIAGDEDPERMQDISTKLGEFHVQNQISDPNATIAKSEVQACIEKIETFFGLGPLRALAPQYQQGDFFERIRSATKAFVLECAEGGGWSDMLSRYRGDNQVPLLTITKSKGLEYDIVVLLGLDDEQWWSFRNNPTEGHSTFFVAASRARERLFMTIRKGQGTAKITEIYKLLEDAGVKALDAQSWKP